MRRRSHRSDDNQEAIVAALRKMGCSVSVIGKPVDLLVGHRSLNFLFEVKNKDGLNRLTTAQEKFIPEWRGQVRIVHTPEEAIKVVTESYRSEK